MVSIVFLLNPLTTSSENFLLTADEEKEQTNTTPPGQPRQRGQQNINNQAGELTWHIHSI